VEASEQVQVFEKVVDGLDVLASVTVGDRELASVIVGDLIDLIQKPFHACAGAGVLAGVTVLRRSLRSPVPASDFVEVRDQVPRLGDRRQELSASDLEIARLASVTTAIHFEATPETPG